MTFVAQASSVPNLTQPKHMHALDGLRGVAAAVVLASHATGMMLGSPVAPRKYLAVHFFWMLSGFVLTHAYQSKLAAGMTLRAYCLRRIIRLYPLIVLGALLGLLALPLTTPGAALTDPHALLATVAAMLCLPVPVQAFSFSRFPVNPPEWSLFYEVGVSVLFGAILFRLPTRALAALAAAAFVGYVLLPGNTIRLMTLPALAAFTGGVVLHRWQHLRVPAVPFVVLAALMIAAACIPEAWGRLADPACLALVFSVVILAGARNMADGWAVRLMGELSYPLYVLHWPVLIACNTLVPRIGAVGAVASGLALSVAVAWIALRAYDVPLRAWLGRRASSQQAQRLPIRNAA